MTMEPTLAPSRSEIEGSDRGKSSASQVPKAGTQMVDLRGAGRPVRVEEEKPRRHG